MPASAIAESEAASGRNQRAMNCAGVGSMSRDMIRARRRVIAIESGSYRSGAASLRSRSRNLSSLIEASIHIRKQLAQFLSTKRHVRAHCPFAQAGHARDLGMLD